MVDVSLLRGYGNINKSTISLTSPLHGGAPSSTHPSCYNHTVKTWISTPLGPREENFGAKEIFGSTFIVEQSVEPPTTDVKDPHVYDSSFIYQEKSLIYHFNKLCPSAFALREWVDKTWWSRHELFIFSKGFFIVIFSTKAEPNAC
jgi:hypothetical protein